MAVTTLCGAKTATTDEPCRNPVAPGSLECAAGHRLVWAGTRPAPSLPAGPAAFDLEDLVGGTVDLGPPRAPEITDFVPGRTVEQPALAFNSCKAVSASFVEWARRHDLDASLVQLEGSPEYPDAFSPWKEIPRERRLHYVAKIGDLYVDWTARQFCPDAPVPLVTTESGWDKEFEIGGASARQVTFSSWEDVHSWARKHAIDVDVGALEKGNAWSPEGLEPVAAAVERANAVFPGLASRVSKITYGALLGEAAHVSINESPMRPVAGSIALHLHAKDARIREAHERDPKQAAENLYEAVLHEMGHVREYATPWMRHRAGAGLDVAKAMNPEMKRGIIRQAMIDAGYADKRGSVTTRLVALDISRYATTSDAEMHAEVFCLMLRTGGIAAKAPETRARLQTFWESVERQTHGSRSETPNVP